MKKILYRLIVIVAAAAATLAFMTSIAYASQLVFSDDFNGPLNTTAWANATPWNTQYTIGELEFYDPADCTFANGMMVLTSEKRATPGYSWTGPFAYTSGITTSLNHTKFSYGYFEIRAKLPKGQGIWPAFWLTNDSTLEIDGLEMLGDRPTRIYQTLHENKQQIYQSIVDGPDYSAGFHTYGIDWQPNYVKWYIDGVLTTTYSAPMPSDGLYICLNTAVGGSWPGAPDTSTSFPVNYDVDYVRVWGTKAAAPVAAPDAYSTGTGIALSVPAPGVLANDTDPQGNGLTAQVVTQPTHGTLSMASNGSFTYVRAAGYSGTDSFTYTAADGSFVSSPSRVSLTVLAAGATVVAKPVVKKTHRTTAKITGSFKVGVGSGILLASYFPAATPVAATPVTLSAVIQRWSRGAWRAYSTKKAVDPPSSYSISFRVGRGTYRVRTLISGGGGIAGHSAWSRNLSVK